MVIVNLFFKNYHRIKWCFISLVVTLKLPVNKTDDSSDAQLDLRAELQRRRGHRAEVINYF